MSSDPLPPRRNVVGLIPAAGLATRISPLPFSKELYPVGFRETGPGGPRPKAVCQFLLERMRLAGIGRAYIVLRSGKWDIPAYLGDGAALGMDLAYLLMRRPYGAPYSLDQATPFVHDALVALGFPDIIFEPADAFARLLERQAAGEADVVLGLFPTDQPHIADMVELAGESVRRIEIKPSSTTLRYTWMIAVWTPVFTRFMHAHLAADEAHRLATGAQDEIFIGHVLQAAIDDGMRVEAVTFADGSCLDIGNPANLVAAVRRYTL